MSASIYPLMYCDILARNCCKFKFWASHLGKMAAKLVNSDVLQDCRQTCTLCYIGLWAIQHTLFASLCRCVAGSLNVKVFQLSDFSGDHIGFQSTVTSMGAGNDKISMLVYPVHSDWPKPVAGIFQAIFKTGRQMLVFR